MLKRHVEGFRALFALHKIALAVEKAQLFVVDVHVAVQDLVVIEVDPAVVTMKT